MSKPGEKKNVGRVQRGANPPKTLETYYLSKIYFLPLPLPYSK
jgi:hypothetical protein